MNAPTVEGVTGSALVAGAVTALFVPGDRPERFAKAAAAGADVVILDLEDAVATSAKAGALSSVLDALAAGYRDGATVRALVRVNAVDSQNYNGEIAALLALAETPGNGLLGLMLPKAENAVEVRRLKAKMPAGLALVVLIESAVGLVNLLELAAVSGVTRLAFGAIDFALDIDAAGGDRFLDYARSQLVVASRACNISAPLDSPSTEIKNPNRVKDSARMARNFGFGGKLCIHPAQLAAVREAFAPTETEISWALSVIEAEAEAGAGAAQVDGQMIDRPVIERANRMLLRRS